MKPEHCFLVGVGIAVCGLAIINAFHSRTKETAADILQRRREATMYNQLGMTQ